MIKDKKYFYQSLTVVISILVVVFGWVYLIYGTTIGTDIETVNLLVTGTSTLATTTIGTNFYIDEAGNASTTGYFNLANASTTGTLVVGGETNLVNLIYGGSVTALATSEPARVQMTAAEFCDSAVVTVTDDSASATTMYLPNATQLVGDCLPAAGDTKETLLMVLTNECASTTITASTSIDLLMEVADVDTALNAGGGATQNESALIKCTNQDGSTVICTVRTLMKAD